jgi:RimJ/RimL family protein N-acetyltransferase
MEFRRLLSQDLDSYYANRLRGLQVSPSAFMTTYAEQVEKGSDFYAKLLAEQSHDNVIFGALQGGKVVGASGIFRMKEKPKTAHKAMIWGMYVDEDARGKGIGGKLIDLAVQHARDVLKVPIVYLTVESENSAALKLYQSRGFKAWGTEPMAMKEGGRFCDDTHMALIFK